MSDPFIGEIRIMPYNFAPMSWAWCNGQTLQIGQSAVLHSVLGNVYGGDGRTTFALPDLQGRAPMHWGAGQGLTEREIGKKAGAAGAVLAVSNLPSHSHTVKVAQLAPTLAQPTANVSYPSAVRREAGTVHDPCKAFHAWSADTETAFSDKAMASAGTSPPAAHGNYQPVLCLNFCIALEGEYPAPE